MDFPMKKEIPEMAPFTPKLKPKPANDAAFNLPAAVIELSSSSSSSSSSSDSDIDDDGGSERKKRKLDDIGVVLPVGFLAPLQSSPSPSPAPAPMAVVERPAGNGSVSLSGQSCKQFWKAGDYEGAPVANWDSIPGGMDHVRVHPKFLHSNATSHKWALGAFAELLDNSLDEVLNGATYVNIDMVKSRKDESRMILIEDNGGGMDPDKMRHCMSLGYSAKNKMANTIGQYGNGFKTSTMRLGADVIVFSRCRGKDGKSPTQSIGLLSYTFLRSTGKEDIVVPMLDYQKEGQQWKKIVRYSIGDWHTNMETLIQWSPFSSEADFLRQFNLMSDHGTRIIIYNLWEDDQGLLELDFDADPHDIQLRGVNRDEKNIRMAREFPNSRHFLTYRHSLRSYVSILYLRLPPSFRIILRGKDVEHHNIVNDMMLSQEITYRPQPATDGVTLPRDMNMTAVVTIGFVKDAKHHIDVQGFNVYHKNRLIKPFWRLWNAAGSDGRGVIGVLEANFVEPAHDKQGFERTTVLARLESRLIQMQKTYWSTYCDKIGYAPRRNKKHVDSDGREISDDCIPNKSPQSKKYSSVKGKSSLLAGKGGYRDGQVLGKGKNRTKTPNKYGKGTLSGSSSPSLEDISDDPSTAPAERTYDSTQKASPAMKSFEKDRSHRTRSSSHIEDTGSQQENGSGGNFQPLAQSQSVSDSLTVEQLKQENSELKKRLAKREGDTRGELMHGLQCDKCKSLELQLQEAQKKMEELNMEQESLINIFSEERERRDKEEENLRKKLKDASNTIRELLDKVRLLENMKSPSFRSGR